MYDTVKIISPFLPIETVDKVTKFCVWKIGIELMTNDSVYEFVQGSLKNTFDHRIGISVNDNRLVVEGSVHKAISGQNIFGGPDNLVECVRWLVNQLQSIMGVELPEVDEWQVVRVDVAYGFYLGGLDAVLEWFRDNTKAYYPSRKKREYHGGLYFAGQTTTLKFYAKGLEFIKHDFKRLKKILEEEFLMRLTEFAYGILRVEVEVKNKKLKNMFGKEEVYIKDLVGKDYMFEQLYNMEVGKISKQNIAIGNLKSVVRDYDKVVARLEQCYSKNLSRALLATWFRLSADGYDMVLGGMSKSTFHRHVKQLREAGISWEGSDVIVGSGNRLVPDDFFPVTSDDRMIGGKFVLPKFLVA